MRLKPLLAKQIYVSGMTQEMANAYRDDNAGLANQHSIQAIFEPINDTSLVLVFWAFGGFNPTPRASIKILDLETHELHPAWE